MSDENVIRGSLEDLPLTDILHILSAQKKTGTLVLQRLGEEGMIALRNGMIVYAISPRVRQNLTEILLKYGVVSDHQVEEALSRQQQENYSQRLTDLFVSLGFLTREQLAKAISWNIENAVYDLFKWKAGDFIFEIDSVHFDQRVVVDPENLSLEFGVSPQFLLWEASEKLVEQPPSTENGAEIAVIPRVTSPELVAAPEVEPEQVPERNDRLEASGFDLGQVDVLFDLLTGKGEGDDTEVSPENRIVLIVDDEAFFRRMLVDQLQKKGFSVLGCSGVQDALQEIEQYQALSKPFLAIIIDAVMPETEGTGILGGFELLNKINVRALDIPVLVISASHDDELRYKAYELGSRNFLDKPVPARESYQASKRALEMFVDEISFCLMRIARETASSSTIPPGRKPGEERGGLPQIEQVPDMTSIQREIEAHTSVSESLSFLLRVAYEYFDRGLIFLVRKSDIIGLMGYDQGTDHDTFAADLTRIRLPRTLPIIYNRIIGNPYPFLGLLEEEDGLSLLEREIPGFIRGSQYIVPLICEGKVIAILHFNNSLTERQIDNIHVFEFTVLQVGLAVQRILLTLKMDRQKRSERDDDERFSWD